MSERRLYLDTGVGESRGVVTLDGRPERLMILRDGDLAIQALGARAVARVRKVERATALAFLDLGEGPDAILNITAEAGRLVEGQAVEVEVRAEVRGDKGANVRLIGPAEGAPRLLVAPPSLEERLLHYASGAEIMTGRNARGVADAAQDEALQTIFSLQGGGSLAIEATRALTAVDVDLGDRRGSDTKRVARSANLAALTAAARLLRLKGLGGLIVIDFVGRGHDAPVMLSAARAAFGPDNPGVALGPVSRFGTLELTVPRRARPAIDILNAGGADASPLTKALALIRALEREAGLDGGVRLIGLAAPVVVDAAIPALAVLNARLGGRLSLRAELGRVEHEVVGA